MSDNIVGYRVTFVDRVTGQATTKTFRGKNPEKKSRMYFFDVLDYGHVSFITRGTLHGDAGMGPFEVYKPVDTRALVGGRMIGCE